MSMSFCLSEVCRPFSRRMLPESSMHAYTQLFFYGREKQTTRPQHGDVYMFYLLDSHYGRTLLESGWTPAETWTSRKVRSQKSLNQQGVKRNKILVSSNWIVTTICKYCYYCYYYSLYNSVHCVAQCYVWKLSMYKSCVCKNILEHIHLLWQVVAEQAIEAPQMRLSGKVQPHDLTQVSGESVTHIVTPTFSRHHFSYTQHVVRIMWVFLKHILIILLLIRMQ